jgi:hypothetical protein
MGEYRRRAVDGDLPAPTRVWSRLLPRQEPALRSPLIELLPGQETWIWSSTDSISSSRTGAFDKETLVDVPIFPIIQVLRELKTDRARPLSSVSGGRCGSCQPVQRDVVEQFIETQHIIAGNSISSQFEAFLIDLGSLPRWANPSARNRVFAVVFFKSGNSPTPCP